MERGFVPDYGGEGGYFVPVWHPGKPEPRKFLGLITTASPQIDLTKTMAVRTYRCPQCGLLKSYASTSED
jgi:hypothetical protein